MESLRDLGKDSVYAPATAPLLAWSAGCLVATGSAMVLLGRRSNA